MRLLEPLSIGLRTAPNRLLFGPHETNLGWGRAFSDRHVGYYEARAAGGCGTIVTETASVHPTDWPYERCPDATDRDQLVTGWSAIRDACAPHGALIIGSLGHSGGQGSSAYSQRELWAPSDEPDTDTREIPKVMEHEDIAAVVAGFANGARAAKAAGLDGVEINAGQHALLRQFMSGLTNRRSDSYGMESGSLLMARQVLEAVRSELGHDQVVGLRLSCDEMAPWAGISPERGAEIAATLAPMLDYLVVVRGSIFTEAQTRPDAHSAAGFNMELATAVAKAVWEVTPSVAMFVQGSIVDPRSAEAAISDGLVDGVEMTRAQIADPQLVAKVSAGHIARIRPCVLCNQLCMVRNNRNPIVSCIANPRAGYETLEPDPDLENSDSFHKKAILIVGGGPAGMEAARVAAQRGARVRLLEASPEMGGMVKVARVAPGRERLGAIVLWLESECRRLGVAIGAGTVATPELIARFSGKLIMATGSRPRVPEYEIDADAISLTAAEALAGSITLPPGPIAIWDPIGGLTGVAVAEAAVASGREVLIITPDQMVGSQLARTSDLAEANTRLQQAGVSIIRRSRVVRVANRRIELQDVFTNDHSVLGAVALIDAGYRVPNDHLLKHLEGDFETIGDVVAPRTIAEAIREGRAAGLAATTVEPTPLAGSVS